MNKLLPSGPKVILCPKKKIPTTKAQQINIAINHNIFSVILSVSEKKKLKKLTSNIWNSRGELIKNRLVRN